MKTTDENEAPQGLVIPKDQLPPEVLQKIIEEFVLEEGTDYGHQEFSLKSKVDAVLKQLNSGQLELVFNPESETCSIRKRF